MHSLLSGKETHLTAQGELSSVSPCAVRPGELRSSSSKSLQHAIRQYCSEQHSHELRPEALPSQIARLVLLENADPLQHADINAWEVCLVSLFVPRSLCASCGSIETSPPAVPWNVSSGSSAALCLPAAHLWLSASVLCLSSDLQKIPFHRKNPSNLFRHWDLDTALSISSVFLNWWVSQNWLSIIIDEKLYPRHLTSCEVVKIITACKKEGGLTWEELSRTLNHSADSKFSSKFSLLCPLVKSLWVHSTSQSQQSQIPLQLICDSCGRQCMPITAKVSRFRYIFSAAYICPCE